MTIVAEIQSLSPSAIINLYEIDLTPFGDTIYRFHNGTNDLQGNIVWQGNDYVAYPIDITGYSITTKGAVARPNMRISNILNIVSTIITQLDDILGAKVTRISTFAKFLDAVNFPSGTNSNAQFATFTNQVYYIERKVLENLEYIEFELSAPWDIHNERIPNRQIIQNTCIWVYRGAECGYAGPDVADIRNNYVSSPLYDGFDACAKDLTGCKFRFTDILPFGGFPGANKY